MADTPTNDSGLTGPDPLSSGDNKKTKLKDKLAKVVSNVSSSEFAKNLVQGSKDMLDVVATKTPALNSIVDQIAERKRDKKEKSNQINSTPVQTNPNQEQASPNINQIEPVGSGSTERTTEDAASITTNSPEVAKAETAVSPGTNINLNLEKTTEKPAEVISSESASAPINQSGEIPKSPINVEPTSTTVTQQSVDLSKTINVSESTVNSQSGGENSSTTNTVSPSTSTSSETTINQTGLTSENKKPGLFKKALSSAGKALSPLAERLGENSKDLLDIASSRPLIKASINAINKVRANNQKETSGANALNFTKSSPTATQTNKASANTTNQSSTVSNVTSTTNQPSLETNVEKINPSVEGKPTTANVETKTETQIQQPASTQPMPTLTEVKSTAPTPTPSSVPQPQPQTGGSVMDISSLEKRLKKIEIALTNPLEVIIKDH